jgi:3-oxoadipate enol-lactonase
MAEVVTDGTTIWWDSHGEGPPVVLISGFTSTSDMWYLLLPYLTGDYRVIQLDNRGVGRSEAPDGPYSILTMANDALAVLDAAGETRAHIIGISMGSCIAQEIAVVAPERVRSLVLAASNPGTLHSVYPSPEAMTLIAAGAQSSFEDFNRSLIPVTYHPNTDRNRIEEDIERRLRQPTSEQGILGQQLGVAGWDRFDDLPHLTMPTLVLHGTDDLLDPVENGRVLAARIPGATLVELDGASHQIFTDQEAACASEIRRFLQASEVTN